MRVRSIVGILGGTVPCYYVVVCTIPIYKGLITLSQHLVAFCDALLVKFRF